MQRLGSKHLSPPLLQALTQSLCLWHWAANIEGVWLQLYSELPPNTALFTTANECPGATEARVRSYNGTWHLVKINPGKCLCVRWWTSLHICCASCRFPMGDVLKQQQQKFHPTFFHMTRLISTAISCWIRILDSGFFKPSCAVGEGLLHTPDGNHPVELKWKQVAGLLSNVHPLCFCTGKRGSTITFILFQSLWQDDSRWCSDTASSVLMAAFLLPASCSKLRKTQCWCNCSMHPECVRADLALVCPLSWSCCWHARQQCRGAGGSSAQASTTWLLERCSCSHLSPRGCYELSPSQMLLLINLTIAINSTRGLKIPVSCAWPTMFSWGIWGWKAFFLIINMGVRHPAALSGIGNFFPHLLHNTNGVSRSLFLQGKHGVLWKMCHCPAESSETQKHQSGTVTTTFTWMEH